MAKLSAPTLPVLANAYGGTLVTTAPSQTFQFNLANSSTWLDLAAVIKAQLDDANTAWNVSFLYNGQDITAAVESSAGFCFYQGNRLNPGVTATVSVVVASKSGQVSSSPLDVSVQLQPHPTTPVINQTFHLRNFTPLEAESATVVGVVIATNQTGYSGTGFVDYQNNTGDYVEWSNVTVPETGSYTLQFRYALNGPASTTRPLQLTVNGTAVATNPFPGTGTWTTWGITTNLVTLNAARTSCA